MILGALETSQYTQQTMGFEDGDTILIASDGITDTKNSDNTLFGEERLRYVIKQYNNEKKSNLKQYIYDELNRFNNNVDHQEDDLTIVTIDYSKKGWEH